MNTVTGPYLPLVLGVVEHVVKFLEDSGTPLTTEQAAVVDDLVAEITERRAA